MIQGLDILEDYRSKEDLGKKNAIGQLLTVGDIQMENQALTWEEAFRRSIGRKMYTEKSSMRLIEKIAGAFS